MVRQILIIVVGVAIASYATLAFASDVDNGRKLARKCSACHGKEGISRDPEVPIIAGQHAFYLEKALKDYQGGNRHDRRMTLIVKRLTDDDIADLSAWFASFEVSIQKPK